MIMRYPSSIPSKQKIPVHIDESVTLFVCTDNAVLNRLRKQNRASFIRIFYKTVSILILK